MLLDIVLVYLTVLFLELCFSSHLCVVPGGKGGKGGKDNWGKSGKAAPPSKGGKGKAGKAGKAATGGKGPKGATLEPAKVNDSKRSSAWIERHR